MMTHTFLNNRPPFKALINGLGTQTHLGDPTLEIASHFHQDITLTGEKHLEY